MRKVMEVGISFFGCFFAIYWLPFARMNFSLDAFTTTILNPVDFLLGGISFLVGFIFHARLLHRLASIKKMYKKSKRSAFVVIGGYLLPITLIIFSIKVLVSFFIFSTIYGIISLSSPINHEDNIRTGKGE